MPTLLPFSFATHFSSANHNVRHLEGAGDGNPEHANASLVYF